MSAARSLAAAATVVLLSLPLRATAADPTAVSLQGSVAHPAILRAADLARQPATNVTVSFDTEHGPQHGTYTGELLWTLLNGAGLVDAPGKRTRLQHTILARGSDGYAAALAIGEIDPLFEGKQVIVAYAEDGKPLSGLRLVVPDDKHGGRNVHDLVTLDIR